MSDERQNKGLKISNNKSIFSKDEMKKSISFEEKANDVFNNYNTRNLKCIDLGKKLILFLEDKTLLENKSPVNKNLEAQVVSEFIEICNEINNDESEKEGIGSMAVMTLLIKTVLHQRDKMNEIYYKLHKLELNNTSKDVK